MAKGEKTEKAPEGKEGWIRVEEKVVKWKDPHEKHGPKLPASMKALGIAAVVGALLALGLMLSVMESSSGGRQAGVQTPPGPKGTAATPTPWHKGLLGSPGSAPDPIIRNGGSAGSQQSAALLASCGSSVDHIEIKVSKWVPRCRFDYDVNAGTVEWTAKDGRTHRVSAGQVARWPAGFEATKVAPVGGSAVFSATFY